jgi:sugar phosphate isomerase/epimerase
MDVINAKEAGADVLRTVCLSGRRYENFKSWTDFENFRKQSILSLQLVEPMIRKHKIKLAVENHKDWRAPELESLLKEIDSEWLGVTLDFGNSIALMEDPMDVVNTLAPYVMSTHVKDMAVKPYEDGFLLSGVPIGTGILDLPEIVKICKKYNPQVRFSLEMITRDPLKIPCLTDGYWPTFQGVSGSELARSLRMVRDKEYKDDLPRISHLTDAAKLEVEENNVVDSLGYSRNKLSLI